MSELHVVLSRSHFDQLLVVAANPFGENEAAGVDWQFGDSGWRTSWDGGQNVHYPYEFVSLYFVGSGFGVEAGEVPEVWALHQEDDLLQGNRYKGTWFLRLSVESQLFYQVTTELDRFGQNREFGVSQLVCTAQMNGRYKDEDDWQLVAADKVPPKIKGYLEKGIAQVRASFGQGGEFFE